MKNPSRFQGSPSPSQPQGQGFWAARKSKPSQPANQPASLADVDAGWMVGGDGKWGKRSHEMAPAAHSVAYGHPGKSCRPWWYTSRALRVRSTASLFLLSVSLLECNLCLAQKTGLRWLASPAGDALAVCASARHEERIVVHVVLAGLLVVVRAFSCAPLDTCIAISGPAYAQDGIVRNIPSPAHTRH